MKSILRGATAILMVVGFCGAQVTEPASAAYTNYYKTRVHYAHPVHHYFAAHPKVKAAAIGAGVGLGAGALTGLLTHRGVARGALIGAGTGAGVGLIRTSRIMRAHPIVRDLATGGAIGLSLGWAGTRNGAGAGLLVGSALGLGAGVLRHRLD
jgi:hypothetical protein